MWSSYDGPILDNLAAHMKYLSSASSFWYHIESSYDHKFHLSKQLGMSPDAYGHLLEQPTMLSCKQAGVSP